MDQLEQEGLLEVWWKSGGKSLCIYPGLGPYVFHSLLWDLFRDADFEKVQVQSLLSYKGTKNCPFSRLLLTPFTTVKSKGVCVFLAVGVYSTLQRT